MQPTVHSLVLPGQAEQASAMALHASHIMVRVPDSLSYLLHT